ncbi:uncharacterized protein FOMMEDRAFT_117231 [Fomitiporia mediterranea MF3/22]|uniref:uncharacterized protein n=1 Tax=Fomitiporia mediterranea (strain MF3/22) TaxID=694068 RepID=UPI0004409BD8|nr:uncharacterized protein FOMMEDRAFT_117231 [Fomitiporia mediterranea MF3/22]EJD06417.1 hypothetical protein FOMMEDRAFT_117231 [Fomitiporia mediterranea MF3/22]
MPPSAGTVRLVFVAFIVLQALLWSQGRYGSSPSHNVLIGLMKRSVGGDECTPLSVPIAEQCAHVQENCDVSHTVLSIPYLQNYFCSAPPVRPLVFGGLLLWLVFLFSTLGISASDFFCPNLATLASRLGLDENVAGVTFLALGNGSPDVFSTFSAMRAGAGALAIGELLGAASFIVSVVAGTMCIIRPFSVDARPFLRDVGFFTAAVALLLVILWDGEILAWEAGILIALYILYVMTVIVGSWWDRRQFRRKQLEAIVRSEYADGEVPEPYRDDPSEYLSVPSPTPPRTRAHSSPAAPPTLGIETAQLRPRPHSRSPSPTPAPQITQMPSFSLVGALEFRQVVSSLQQQSAGAALSAFESPVSPYIGGHYHSHSHSHSRSPLVLSRRASSQSSHSIASQEHWDDALPLHSRSPRSQTLALQDTEGETASAPANLSVPPSSDTQIPVISTIPASPSSESSFDSGNFLSSPYSKRQRVVHVFGHTMHVLFPTLHHFRDKSALGMIASVLAAPAVFFLTVTLPVQVTPRGDVDSEEKIGAKKVTIEVPEGRLVDFEEEGVERVLTAEEDVQEEMHELKFNKWLMAVQLLLGPLFCVAVLFSGMETHREMWLLIATAIGGVAAALLVLAFAERGNDPVAQMARCFMGFFVAVVWIMAIADEVVNVLKTFGFIFGLSDAIIGLTIFAVGNSLADFVANISVATFAPVMGFSACFGGPMLNILLGVGVSGSAVISHANGAPYPLDFSTTLVVSTIGLLVLLVATLVGVPLNGYHLTRPWGIFLVLSYIVVMIINITVEVRR